MWNGKMKALTFSYDDGVNTDERLAAIFDKYGLKCTFNLNGCNLFHKGSCPEARKCKFDNSSITYVPVEDFSTVYKNHEIALHSYSHPRLEELDRAGIEYEIKSDIAALDGVLGKKPVGMAYPFGTYNDTVVDVLRENGVKYARAVKPTYSFDLQSDLLRFYPTCRHGDERLFELADEFLNATPTGPMLFFVWGHSYEFADNNNWDLIERFCEYVSGRDDIYYCTNAEALL